MPENSERKTLYLIGGTMGVGKTAVCRQLKKDLPRSVFLDGDWCWDADPFIVTDETKEMVLENICFLLNQFLRCSAYRNILFCWVMDRQSTLDSILQGLDTADCRIQCISLTAEPECIRARLAADIKAGLRSADVIERSIARIPLYASLNTLKIDTSHKSIRMTADEIRNLQVSGSSAGRTGRRQGNIPRIQGAEEKP